MRRHKQLGFSLVELLIVVAIALVVMGVGALRLVPALRALHMDSTSALVQTELRTARAKAIANRGEVIVTFSTAGTIATTAPNITGFDPSTVSLPSDVQFYVFSGLPNTPDSFLPGGSAIAFDQGGSAGNPLKIRFEPNGSAVDDAGSLNSGVVFVGQPGNLGSQRAITLLGATARVRTWRIVVQNGVATAWN